MGLTSPITIEMLEKRRVELQEHFEGAYGIDAKNQIIGRFAENELMIKHLKNPEVNYLGSYVDRLEKAINEKV